MPALFAETNRVGVVTEGPLSKSVGYGFLGNAPCAYDGLLVWTVGPSLFGPPGRFWIQNLSTTPAGVNASNLSAHAPGALAVNPVSIVFEPQTERIWITDLANGRVHRIDPGSLNADTSVALMFGGNPYGATGLVAVGGKLYACGVFNIGAPGEDGRLFEIDPVAATVTRVSTGANLGLCLGVDYDPDTLLFFVGGADGFTFAGGSLSTVSRQTFVGANLTLVPIPGAPAIDSPIWPRVAYGSVWVGSPVQTLWNFDKVGNAKRWFRPNPVAPMFSGQQPASDGQGFLWFPDGGKLHLLSPNDPGPLMTEAASVLAPAGGALVLVEGRPPTLVP